MLNVTKTLFQYRQPLLVIGLFMVAGVTALNFIHAAVLGDINGDGAVNVNDLSILLSKWGTSYAPADLNRDGTVNILDLSVLLAHWGQTASPSPTSSPSAPPVTAHSANHWLMVTNLVNTMKTDAPASADYFYNTPNAFTKNGSVSGYGANPIASYTSYAQFSADLANGTYPGNHWVMYGLESTTNSPTIEKQQPELYLPKFAQLAHKHGLYVVEVPGRDLVDVSGADCHANAGENMDAAYIRCQIPSDSAQADIFLCQAQGDQSDATVYENLVVAAKSQAKAQSPGLVVMSGLTTDRSDTVQQVYDSWKISRNDVSGYWMNSTSATLPVAEQAMDEIRASGG